MGRKNTGQVVMAIMMGVMLVGALVIWVATGDFHMMPGHGKKNSHTNADAVSSTDDTLGNAPDPAVDQRGPDPEHVIEAEPTPDNP